MLIAVISTSIIIPVSASSEDDGYTYPDDASEEEKEEIDEQEQEAWEDAGRPGDSNDDDDDDNDENSNDNDDENSDDDDPNPYCDTDKGKAAPVCHDRLDYNQDTGLYPCNDGTEKKRWQDCKDATVKNVKNNHSTKTLQTATTTTTSTSAEESSCRLDGSADGIQQTFDSIKYQACGLYLNGQKAYSDGFIMGCTQVGNTQLICQALVDSSILNTKTQQMQTSTTPQPPTQSTPQTMTPSSQAIQPASRDF
jgi:hypothetical protein